MDATTALNSLLIEVYRLRWFWPISRTWQYHPTCCESGPDGPINYQGTESKSTNHSNGLVHGWCDCSKSQVLTWQDMTFEEAVALANEKETCTSWKHYTEVGQIINAFSKNSLKKPDATNIWFTASPSSSITTQAKKPEDPRFTDRFELFIMTKEAPMPSRNWMIQSITAVMVWKRKRAKELGDDSSYGHRPTMLKPLEYGKATNRWTWNCIDRLVMLLTNVTTICDVLLPNYEIVKENTDRDQCFFSPSK